MQPALGTVAMRSLRDNTFLAGSYSRKNFFLMRTVVCLDFESTALLRYGQYPYGTVFCTAIAVYGTVESPRGDRGGDIIS